MSVLQYSCLCCLWTYTLCSTRACITPGRVCSTANCVAQDMSVLQQPVLFLDMFVLHQTVVPWTCLFFSSLCCHACACSTTACAAPEHVYFLADCAVPVLKVSVLQQPVVNPYMSAYKNICTAPGRVCLQKPVLHLGGGWVARFFEFLTTVGQPQESGIRICVIVLINFFMLTSSIYSVGEWI